MAGTRSRNQKDKNNSENKIRRDSGNNDSSKNPPLDRRDIVLAEILDKKKPLSDIFESINDKKATVEDLSVMLKGVIGHLEENCDKDHLISITNHCFDGIVEVSKKM